MTTVAANSTANSTMSTRSYGKILRTGAATAAIAVLINVLLYTIGLRVNLPTDAVPLASVIMVTLMGGVAATVGYAVLTRFLSARIANRVMWIGIVLVLIGMAYNPFTINASIVAVVILEIMHVVATLPAWQLTRIQ